MAFENVVVEVEDHVGVIRLDRPKKLNALNDALRSELMEALGRYDADDKVSCMIITGSDTVFCAGADINEMEGKNFVSMFAGDGFADDAHSFMRLRKPVIAAVAGPAFGGGCELAMMCDIIIAGDNALFCQPEIHIGVMAGMGGTQRLTRAVGKSKSMEMHLTGRRMTAEEAERAGMVSRVVPVGKLMSEAMEVARKIAEQPPLAVMAVKEAINRAEETSLSEGLLFERRLFHSLFATADKDEGMKAFVAKRIPKFRGR